MATTPRRRLCVAVTLIMGLIFFSACLGGLILPVSKTPSEGSLALGLSIYLQGEKVTTVAKDETHFLNLRR